MKISSRRNTSILLRFLITFFVVLLFILSSNAYKKCSSLLTQHLADSTHANNSNQSFANKPGTIYVHIRVYRDDIPFFVYSLKSMELYGAVFDGFLITFPFEDEDLVRAATAGLKLNVKLAARNHSAGGVVCSRMDSLLVDEMADADYFYTIDSDTILTRPVTVEDLFRNGKPMLLYDTYDSMPQVKGIWKPGTDKLVGVDAEFEFMRRQGLLYPREAFKGLRARLEQVHKKKLFEYALENYPENFSEFNPLGAYLYYFKHDLMYWVKGHSFPDADTEILSMPPFLLQARSWDRMSPRLVAYYECVVAGGDARGPQCGAAFGGMYSLSGTVILKNP